MRLVALIAALWAFGAAAQSIGPHEDGANTSGATTVTTGAITTQAGDTAVLCGVGLGAVFAATPFTDSKSNTWSAAAAELSGSGFVSRCVYSVLTSVGSGHTFSVNFTASEFGNVFVAICRGADATPIVTADRIVDDATPYTSPSIAPATSVCLFAYTVTSASGGTDTHTYAGSFASGDKIEEETDADNLVPGSMAGVLKSAGTYSSSVTTTAGSFAHAWIVSVETGGGGGGSVVPLILQQHE